ncbi:MAG: alpha/beta hydrolase [Candidatus Dormiibacterota bacterium]
MAYEKEGVGPTLILVDGAMTTRSSGSKPELARLLGQSLTVYCYDRRGRGDSGDKKPYAVEREVEDIGALIEQAGGSAFLYGHSSGGCLALDATVALGANVKKLAMYEAPYNDDPKAQKTWREYLKNLSDALASDRPGDAVALFMALVGMPAAQIEGMRHAPFWAGMEALAPTLAYDHTGIMGRNGTIPTERAARVDVPTLVMNGGSGAPFMLETARTLGKVIPKAKLRTLEGQDHNVAPEAVAPLLLEFFAS